MEERLTSAESERDLLQESLTELEKTIETERENFSKQNELLESNGFELQNTVFALQKKLSVAQQEVENMKKTAKDSLKVAIPGSGNDDRVRMKRQDVSSGSISKLKMSEEGQWRHVAPVKCDNCGKGMIWSSIDSDTVLVKGDMMDLVSVEGANHSDVENNGNASENSSIVVQWKKILRKPGSTDTSNSPNNSPNSDSAQSSNVTGIKEVQSVESTAKKDSRSDVPKVESLLSITSCSSENSLVGHEDSSKTEQRLEESQKGADYFLVSEMRRELHRLRKELSDSHILVEELKRNSCAIEETRVQAIRDYNELKAFHERTKKLLSSPESAINIEYLKKCVYRLMITKEVSERSRLYPVISMILKFTPDETREVNKVIQEEVSSSSTLIPGVNPSVWQSASSTLGGLFGGGGALTGTVSSTGEVMDGTENVTTTSSTNSAQPSSSSWW